MRRVIPLNDLITWYVPRSTVSPGHFTLHYINDVKVFGKSYTVASQVSVCHLLTVKLKHPYSSVFCQRPKFFACC